MKYYKLETVFKNTNDRITSSASGDNVINGEVYFNLLKDGRFHSEIPLLSFFHLESYDEMQYWDFQLNDIHSLMGKVNTIIGFYISDEFKNVLDSLYVAPKYNLYETKLLYKEEQKRYWLFQYGIEVFANYNLSNSLFSINNNIEKIKCENEYWEKKREARKKHQSVLKLNKLSIKNNYDFLFNQINADNLVSHKLKTAVEIMGLTGFEFSELDYEVVVE